MSEWEFVTADEQSGWAPGPYPSRTERMGVPGGWIYMRTVWTAIGPHMSAVFVPSGAVNFWDVRTVRENPLTRERFVRIVPRW